MPPIPLSCVLQGRKREEGHTVLEGVLNWRIPFTLSYSTGCFINPDFVGPFLLRSTIKPALSIILLPARSHQPANLQLVHTFSLQAMISSWVTVKILLWGLIGKSTTFPKTKITIKLGVLRQLDNLPNCFPYFSCEQGTILGSGSKMELFRFDNLSAVKKGAVTFLSCFMVYWR